VQDIDTSQTRDQTVEPDHALPESAGQRIARTAKDTPDLLVVVGMVVQWLVEQVGADYGISYDTVMSWAAAVADITRSADGGSMTVGGALIFAACRLGYKYHRGRQP